ncbi:MAG: RNA pseudouridine synthase, partial [Flavobacteriaceae bacterium]
QGDITGDMPLSEVVKAYIKRKYEKPGAVYLGVVHRLDRPTSGAVIFARTSKALARLNRALAQRQAQKIYWAVVRNCPPQEQATLVHWLRKNQKQNKSYVVEPDASASKKAELEYRLIKKLDHYYLLEIELKTGRHHQIRAQLAESGCPIKGDLKYGAARSNKDGSIHLHARALTFEHPVRKEQMEIIAPPPTDPVWNDCG